MNWGSIANHSNSALDVPAFAWGRQKCFCVICKVLVTTNGLTAVGVITEDEEIIGNGWPAKM